MKKNIIVILLGIIAVLAIIFVGDIVNYNVENQNILVVQFGEIIDLKEKPGIFLKAPIIQSTKKIYVGERLYDMPASDVITSDKRSMIADCYVTWKISDTIKYYQSLSSESVAQSRIDVAVYNAMKNVISSMTQNETISGKDGSLGKEILSKVTSLSQYGIVITEIEMKLLDLPDENKEAVYNRMISERNVIAAEYEANGQRDSQNIKSATDASVRKTISEAQVIAANTEAEGETEYFRILADAYSSSTERQEFYNYLIGLDAMKESLSKGGVIVIDENSPLYDVLNNKH